MMNLIKKLLKIPALYPVTECYIIGVAIIVLIATSQIRAWYGISLFGVGAAIIVLFSTRIDDRYDTLCDRIKELEEALEVAKIPTPVEDKDTDCD